MLHAGDEIRVIEPPSGFYAENRLFRHCPPIWHLGLTGVVLGPIFNAHGEFVWQVRLRTGAVCEFYEAEMVLHEKGRDLPAWANDLGELRVRFGRVEFQGESMESVFGPAFRDIDEVRARIERLERSLTDTDGMEG